ncbi:Holliday junction resolvase RuvX [Halanaerobaculum tunisiense]
MRILGLDVGDKRTGVAMSDPLGWTAQGKTVIEEDSLTEELNYISSLVDKYNVDQVVVGLPKNMDGSLGDRAQKVLSYIDELEEELSIPIVTWDERLSTVEAERTLLAADLSRQRRKEVIDKMAAVVILQNYLDMQDASNN